MWSTRKSGDEMLRELWKVTIHRMRRVGVKIGEGEVGWEGRRKEGEGEEEGEGEIGGGEG